MRLSELFTRTKRDAPADETAKNAQLLIKAGFIHKDSAGIYALLPLGLKVIEKIKQIVGQEMNSLGAQELLMTNLQRRELWERTDRWDDKKVDIWFKSKLQNGTDVGLAWSHEEQITEMMREFISSYRDLPVSVYQFQTKLRNEIRAKSGILRTREFIMKDLYSYSQTDKQHQEFYDKTIAAYHRVFKRVGIGDITFFTFASGGAFTKFSHEFQTLTEAGEDTIYLHKAKKIAINQEVMTDEVLNDLGLKKSELEKQTAAEVGNIFSFGGAKSEQLDLYFTDEKGLKKPVILGSYGIGITRLMGVLVELFADNKGLVWPASVAPAEVYLVQLGADSKVVKEADGLYQQLLEEGVGVLYDDRDKSAGEKFADADLLGIPQRLVVSEKTIKDGRHELKARTSTKTQNLKQSEIIKTLFVNT